VGVSAFSGGSGVTAGAAVFAALLAVMGVGDSRTPMGATACAPLLLLAEADPTPPVLPKANAPPPVAGRAVIGMGVAMPLAGVKRGRLVGVGASVVVIVADGGACVTVAVTASVGVGGCDGVNTVQASAIRQARAARGLGLIIIETGTRIAVYALTQAE